MSWPAWFAAGVAAGTSVGTSVGVFIIALLKANDLDDLPICEECRDTGTVLDRSPGVPWPVLCRSCSFGRALNAQQRAWWVQDRDGEAAPPVGE